MHKTPELHLMGEMPPTRLSLYNGDAKITNPARRPSVERHEHSTMKLHVIYYIHRIRLKNKLPSFCAIHISYIPSTSIMTASTNLAQKQGSYTQSKNALEKLDFHP